MITIDADDTELNEDWIKLVTRKREAAALDQEMTEDAEAVDIINSSKKENQ